MQIRKQKFFLILIILFLILPLVPLVAQESIKDNFYVLNLDDETVRKGYTIAAFAGNFNLGLWPRMVQEATAVEFKIKNELTSSLPANKKLASDIIEFDIKNKETFDRERFIYFSFSYVEENDYLKQIYYWDGEQNDWRLLPSQTIFEQKRVRSLIHLPYAKLALLEDPQLLAQGVASWYKYKNCDCAASPDWPKGTQLRVTNLDNDKSVVVEVNDYGPDRAVHPDRAIDLDKTAFEKIASLRAGLVDVKVEPVKEVMTLASASATRLPSLPEVSAKAAVVVDATSSEILGAKNVDEVLPIASLTKLMTAQVFLETDPDWEEVVTYQEEDEIGGAKLYIKPGETLRVRDLFFSMLVGSANNAAYALARSTGLSQEEFVARLNKKAKEWGLNDTQFVEMSGLDASNQSSVGDLAVMIREIFKNFRMLEATTTREYKFSTINTGKVHRIKNTNKLLESDLYLTGGKTGYLEEIGPSLTTKARQGEQEVLVIVLGSENGSARFSETEMLIRWGFEQL